MATKNYEKYDDSLTIYNMLKSLMYNATSFYTIRTPMAIIL